MTMLLTLFMPIAMADANDTTLEVSLYGMTLLPTGEWRSEAIAGSFTVYQDGEKYQQTDRERIREHKGFTCQRL